MQTSYIPLAERMRPRTLDNVFGQEHLTGNNAPLRKAMESGKIPSMILWGPPGVGKTTLARMLTGEDRPFYTLSAVNSGVKDVRETIKKAESGRMFNPKPPVLFIDEIHRFSKSQQDSLLAAVENGTFVLIGATTENPSFEVITPLLSRAQVYVLKPLDEGALDKLVAYTIE
ncbi:MAG TPA: AAA family ATPase, partial [Bacteroidales bacterium]|nr:AAA family ATPase [Bacteroidales bacterium]